MSETASFVDSVFLARFGLARSNCLDYFLHPLNPFRTKANTSNEVLGMQGISIGMLTAHGVSNEGPMPPIAAEEEYNKALSRLTGEQYELLPPVVPKPNPANPEAPLPTLHQLYAQPAQLYTIRHILRTSPTSTKVLGIYYVVEGVIYKSPTVRSLTKTNVARTALEGLHGAVRALGVCARYQPAIGYTWVFEQQQDGGTDDKYDDDDPVALDKLVKKRKRRRILDHRRPGERTAAEEEGIRASEAMDQILVRISKDLTRRAKESKRAADGSVASSKESSRRNSMA